MRHLDFFSAEGFSSLLSGKKISFHRPLSASKLRQNLVKRKLDDLDDSSGVYVYIFKNSLRNWMLTPEGPWGGVRSGSGWKLVGIQRKREKDKETVE